MENKKATHNVLHYIFQLVLSICTFLLFFKLTTQ